MASQGQEPNKPAWAHLPCICGAESSLKMLWGASVRLCLVEKSEAGGGKREVEERSNKRDGAHNGRIYPSTLHTASSQYLWDSCGIKPIHNECLSQEIT